MRKVNNIELRKIFIIIPFGLRIRMLNNRSIDLSTVLFDVFRVVTYLWKGIFINDFTLNQIEEFILNKLHNIWMTNFNI
jgi:hypothetical protein